MSEIVTNDAIVEWKRKRRRKWMIRAVFVLVLCGAGAVVYWQWPEEEVAAVPQNETLQVERGDVTETLAATGTVKASKEVNLNFTGESTDKLAAVHVVPGDRVKAGQVLARLDDTEARNQAQSAADDLAMAKNKLEEVLKGPKPEDVEIQRVNVQRAKAALEAAKQDFDLEEARSQKEQAFKQLELARKAYDDQKFLLEEGAIPANEMEQAEQALEKAEQDYKALERSFSKIEYQHQQAIEDADISYQLAQAELKKIQAPADDSAVEAARIEVRRAQTALQQKQDSLTKLEIKAPWDGVILKVNGDVGTSPTPPFIVMNNASANNLMIAAKIGQSDIVKVQTGLKAVFHTNAYPGEEFKGEVKFVSPEPSTEEGSTAYSIELSVENPEGKLKTGMVMEISILLGTHKDVLFVPSMALRSEAGQDGVYLARNPAVPDVYEFVPVELGFYTPDRVELKSGVKEGDLVVIPAPAPPPEDPTMGGMG